MSRHELMKIAMEMVAMGDAGFEGLDNAVTTPGAKATGLPQVLHLKLYSPTVIVF